MSLPINSLKILSLLLALTLYACGSNDDGENALSNNQDDQNAHTPGLSLSADFAPDPPLPDVNDPAAQDAVRFLMQSTFGPTAKDIVHVMDIGYEAWIDEQMAIPLTSQLEYLDSRLIEIGQLPIPRTVEEEMAATPYDRGLQRRDIWWETAVWGPDQLRQRVAYALSQIFVISQLADVLDNDDRSIADYHDMLARGAFGNYRNLLEEITLSHAMGQYLSMLQNIKAIPELNSRPDENYAREIMQLFSIGLVELNQDGSEQLDGSNQPIPTYTQETVKEFAKVFTGWTFGVDMVNFWCCETTAAETVPLAADESLHDLSDKFLLNGQINPAGLTAEEDLQLALDNIFAHSNVGPFISKQLIQRLVTSNPSPAYVARIAAIFDDNGSGVRGDLAAVVKAILLDDEARFGHLNSPDTFGKLKEPVIKITSLWRAFNAQGTATYAQSGENLPITGPETAPRIRYHHGKQDFGQEPYFAPSVFNFYEPDFQQPGEIVNADLVGPEFQILTENWIVSGTNRFFEMIWWQDKDNPFLPTTFEYRNPIAAVRLNLEDEKPLTSDLPALLDRLDLLLLAGLMSDQMRDKLTNHLQILPAGDGNQQATILYETLFAIVTSPEFAVQR